jgi:hypothetical protein
MPRQGCLHPGMDALQLIILLLTLELGKQGKV